MSPPHDHEEAVFYYRWLIRAAVRRKRAGGDPQKARETIQRFLPIYRQRWRALLDSIATEGEARPAHNDNQRGGDS
ncbi:MAG: hypothetical protein Q7P63_12265 [Verrucomicrobiota bacterium JB022]|nr:hypothetical protein [Verrucomicrobiota bacterium JB022]